MALRHAAATAAATVSLALAAGMAASGGASASVASCEPRTLDNSALLGGAVTVSPLPGSRDAPTRTQISFLGAPARALRLSSVAGSRSGTHRGRLVAYSQGDGASFLPAKPFYEGERVTVRAILLRGGRRVPLDYQFAVARHDFISNPPERVQPVGTAGVQGYVSRPDLRPPAVTVTAQSQAVAPGYIFVAPYSGPGQVGPMILDPSGGLVWFKPLPANVSATNFQVARYLGQPVLTWWQGDVTIHGFGLGEDVIANSAYTEIAHIKAGNGYQSDLHDFQLTARNTALITAYDTQLCGLSSVGGPSSGAVTDGVLQEIDIPTGLVRFQWTSLDHVALADSYELARKSTTAWPFDFFHINSIDPLPDGSLLVSARNTWGVYDLDPHTGQIRWQLGGKHTSFALAPGVATAWQHDPRLLADGTVSIFDNGASPRVHAQSRGVLVSINQQQKSASLLAQFTSPQPILTESQGNLQALANGDWFIGWGQFPAFSEFSSSGQLLFSARLPGHVQSYRAFRFPWQAAPAQPPEFSAQAAAGTNTVYASWNGATAVASWRVLAGPSAQALAPVAQAARSGFETAIPLSPEENGLLATVQALDAGGDVLATAAPKPLPG
jgi:hypothetical protein